MQMNQRVKYDYAKQIFSRKSSQSVDGVEPKRVHAIEYIRNLQVR